MNAALCGAKAKATQQPCRAPAMSNGRCHKHGGAALTGIASATFKTGRYSKYIPARLVERYEEAISDTELLALRDDIGLLDTRIGQVVAALDTGESKETWVALMASVSALEEQWQHCLDDGEPPEEMERTVEAIGRYVRQGLSEGYVWAEIRGLLKERSALVASEQKRLVDMQQYVTSEQAMTFVGAVMASVRRHVSDTRALAGISADLNRLALRDGGRPAATGGVGG
jgi:hypothetical protein